MREDPESAEPAGAQGGAVHLGCPIFEIYQKMRRVVEVALLRAGVTMTWPANASIERVALEVMDDILRCAEIFYSASSERPVGGGLSTYPSQGGLEPT